MDAKTGTVSRHLAHAGWLIVITCALTLSCWSLYTVGRAWGCPPPIAAIISAAFDGAALVCGDLALRHARSPHGGGLGPRLGVFAAAGCSAWLNSQHAVISHDPPAARLLFAAPPVLAVVLLEFQQRWTRRGALHAAGRVAEPLPVLSQAAWVLFPLRSVRVLRAVVGARLDRVRDEHAGSGARVVLAPSEVRRARAWARETGIPVPGSGPLPGPVVSAWAAHLATGNGHPALTRGSKDT